MRFALLADPDGWYARDLTRAAGVEHEMAVLPFSEIGGAIVGSSFTLRTAGVELGAFDAVIVRTMPPGTLEQVVFRMDALAALDATGVVVLNPPKAIETAVDKWLTSARLATAGLPTPRTIGCQTVDDAMLAFEELGRDVVAKPLFGSEGRGLLRIDQVDLAWRAFKCLAQQGAVIYLQEFVRHPGYDVRVLLIGSRAWAIRRHNPNDWRTNVSRGASAEPFVPDDELVALARRAAQAVGAPWCGVDLLPTPQGSWTVLEVNAVPGWKGLARAHNVDIARAALDFVAESVRARRDAS